MFINHVVGSLVGYITTEPFERALRNQASMEVNCGMNYPKTLLHKLGVEITDCVGRGSAIVTLVAMSLNHY